MVIIHWSHGKQTAQELLLRISGFLEQEPRFPKPFPSAPEEPAKKKSDDDSDPPPPRSLHQLREEWYVEWRRWFSDRVITKTIDELDISEISWGCGPEMFTVRLIDYIRSCLRLIVQLDTELRAMTDARDQLAKRLDARESVNRGLTASLAKKTERVADLELSLRAMTEREENASRQLESLKLELQSLARDNARLIDAEAMVKRLSRDLETAVERERAWRESAMTTSRAMEIMRTALGIPVAPNEPGLVVRE